MHSKYIHITEVRVGDRVRHNGVVREVKARDFTYDHGLRLFWDTYQNGNVLVEVVTYTTDKHIFVDFASILAGNEREIKQGIELHALGAAHPVFCSLLSQAASLAMLNGALQLSAVVWC